MKKKLIMILALVVSTLTGAAADKAYIEDFSIKAGETKLIAVNLDSERSDLKRIDGTISMPAGLTVENQGTKTDYHWMTPDDTRTNGAIAQYAPDSEQMAVVGLLETCNPGTGAIAYIKVTAAVDLPGTCTITLSDFTATTEGGETVSIGSENCTVTCSGKAVEFFFSPAALTMAAGSQAEVEVKMDNTLGISGLQAVLITSDGLSIVSVKKGSRVPGLRNNDGRIMTLGNVSGNEGTVFTVTLQAADGFSGTATLTATELAATTSSAQSLQASDIKLTVTVLGPSDVVLNAADDNSQTLKQLDGQQANVTLTRTLEAGGWNTFAVPFSLTLSEAADKGITAVKELSGSSFTDGELKMDFTNATAIEAGKPYLVMVSSDLKNPTFSNVTVSKDAVKTETSAVDFVPTLGKTLGPR